jgi:hypothetical protein
MFFATAFFRPPQGAVLSFGRAARAQIGRWRCGGLAKARAPL